MYICKCHQCKNIFEDIAPSEFSKDFDLRELITVKISGKLATLDKYGKIEYVCPNCLTDNYLEEELNFPRDLYSKWLSND